LRWIVCGAPDVRLVKCVHVKDEKRYEEAIRLLEEGVDLAVQKEERGTANHFRKELLSLYKVQKNKEKLLEINKVLFSEGVDQIVCYAAIKKLTPPLAWPVVLTWVLDQLTKRGTYGSQDLQASILVEHAMWEALWAHCQKVGVLFVHKYETYLRPRFGEAVLAYYHLYVQQQATLSDRGAYRRVADTLNWMIAFDGGPALVRELVVHYRKTYARRPFMMQALNEVKAV